VAYTTADLEYGGKCPGANCRAEIGPYRTLDDWWQGVAKHMKAEHNDAVRVTYKNVTVIDAGI
jgi:hypothetical protein